MMASSSQRLQLTLNAKKEREKVILDYLSQSFNPNAAIKEILYNFIVTQNNSKVVKDTQIEVKKSNSKRVKGTQNNSKLLNNKDTQSNTKILNNTQSHSNIVEVTQNEDILLNLNDIDDTALINGFGNENPVKKNELEQLKEFMR